MNQFLMAHAGAAAPMRVLGHVLGRLLTRVPTLGLAFSGALLLGACATAPVPQIVPPAPPVVSSPVPTPAPAVLDLPPAAAPVPMATPEPEPIVLLPLQPRSRLDPLQDAERSDLWQRVRGGFAMTDIDNELVRKWEGWYARDPAYIKRMTERGGRYLFHILEEVQRRGMPTELALLPFVESAFNPQAMSHARASGMWQFMPGTGKEYELRQNIFRDDRRDVLASTRAALDYLQRLNGMFKDWHLALAAYNWGQGNVLKAIDRNRRAGLPTDYGSLGMPQETRDYVPKLLAIKHIVQRPEAFGLSLAPYENHPFFLSVPIERDIDVALAVRLAGLTLDEFQQLNPQMNKPVILAAGTPRVLLPYDNANRFLQQIARHQGAMASWTAWVAPKTLKAAEAARLTGMNEGALREVNRIPPRMLVKVGSTLLVPRGAHATHDVAEHIADNATMSLAPEARPLRKVSFRAGRQGTTVAAVARRYRVSPALVAQWNKTTAQGQFKPGQAVVVMLPAKPGGKAAAKTSGKASGKTAAAGKHPAGAGKARGPSKAPVRRARRR